jgi:hypothetical protein
MPNQDKPLPKGAPKPKDPPPPQDKPKDKPRVLNSSSLYTIILDKQLVKHTEPRVAIVDGDLVITIKTHPQRHTTDLRTPPAGTPPPVKEVKLKIGID